MVAKVSDQFGIHSCCLVIWSFIPSTGGHHFTLVCMELCTDSNQRLQTSIKGDQTMHLLIFGNTPNTQNLHN